ncbi:hypothetical protein [Sphingomonas hengshuiensis]|uniref:Uncharacterized protein n=1 Tax=Sphingomonas hengshuiensis TaxID=1609977 RepID=A0A7U4J8W3_9SPHN|nr:hypothetical protein [Sphingomonas hengshuiensis]AJP72400.1 hypothetical protein TS85_12295 [Sphingomonas hengshuiensis]
MTSGHEKALSFASPRAAGRYRRLFQVAITHNFYARTGGKCRDFRVVPTDATARLMASLGLAMNDEGAGFSVFFQEGELDNILSYVRRSASGPEGQSGFWSRLTFLLELTRADFIGITALPIGMRQSQQNLFGTNIDAHLPDAGADAATAETPAGPAAVLSAGRFLDSAALRPTVSASVELLVPGTTARVTVQDLSGAVVLAWPTPEEAAEDAAGEAAEAAGTSSPLRAPKRIALDFSGLAHDLYTITAFDDSGDIQPGTPREVLFVPPESDSLVLLDMLFTQPTPDSGGIYPLPSLFGTVDRDASVADTQYRLPFDARQTYWRYYVAPHVRGAQLDALAIVGPGAAFEADPVPVLLPDGSFATLFTTQTPLALRQQSLERFALRGVRRDPSGRENAIRVAPLPVAPPAPVWPAANDQPIAGTSEMFIYV